MNTCNQCQSEFTCDVNTAKNGGQCWCMALPKPTAAISAAFAKLNIKQREAGSSCLCQRCLALRYADNINQLIKAIPHDELIELAAPYRDNKTLIEHIDYTIENGHYVFSKWFFLKRGHCCNNGCRHCPYRQ